MRNLAQMILGTADGAEGAPGGADRKSLLGKFDFKSLLAKKEKAPAPEQRPEKASAAE